MNHRENPGYWNLAQYRIAKKQVVKGNVGLYPRLDGNTAEPVMFVMCKNLNKLQILCSKYIQCPGHFIRTIKRKRYGYYYVRLIDIYLERWVRYMKRHEDWKWVK